MTAIQLFVCVCVLTTGKKVLKFGKHPEEPRNLRCTSFQQGHQAIGGRTMLWHEYYGDEMMWRVVPSMKSPFQFTAMERRWQNNPSGLCAQLFLLLQILVVPIGEWNIQIYCPVCFHWQTFRWRYNVQVVHKPPDPEELGGTSTSNKKVDTKQVPVLRDNHQRVSGPDQAWWWRATVAVKVMLI